VETLGSLVDKLCIVNLKMWHTQEEVYAIRKMSMAEFKKRYGQRPEALKRALDKATTLNVQRNELIDEVDQFFRDVVEGKRKPESLTKPACKVY